MVRGVLTLLAPGQGLFLGISCLHRSLLMESICIPYQQDFAAYHHFWSLMELLLSSEQVKTCFNVSEERISSSESVFTMQDLLSSSSLPSLLCPSDKGESLGWKGRFSFMITSNRRSVWQVGRAAAQGWAVAACSMMLWTGSKRVLARGTHPAGWCCRLSPMCWGQCLLPVSYLPLARRQLTSQASFSPGEWVVMFTLPDLQLLRGQVAVLGVSGLQAGKLCRLRSCWAVSLENSWDLACSQSESGTETRLCHKDVYASFKEHVVSCHGIRHLACSCWPKQPVWPHCVLHSGAK